MRASGVFFGWWVTLAFAFMVFLSTGIRFTVGPFLKPIVADLGLDRAQFSLVISLSLFLYGAFMPFVGRLVDRLGARPVIVTGTLVLAGSVAATGLVRNLWQLYLVYGVCVALGLAATGHVVASAVIARWFSRRRATALSVLGGASMAGMSLLVPAAMWLILTVGWRATYGVLGLVAFLVMMPVALWVVRESPESMGLTPDGLPPERLAAAGPAGERTDVSVAVQTLSFWQLGGGLFTCGFSMSLLSAHGVPMLTDHGYHPMLASWALGLLGGSSVGFAMALGAMADRFGRRPMLAWLYGARALFFAGLFLIRDNPAALLVVVLCGGASMAGSLAMASALTADIFGRFSVGSVFGTIFLVHQAGAALGSWLAGFLFELTGGYGAAFTAASVLLLFAAALSLTIDERAQAIPRLHPVAGGR
ncbi:MAG: MFS transporter [Candidatus Rokubacteria bacterium]|nr:MFS transporter [Candidatus Rokubacteria bacterium]